MLNIGSHFSVTKGFPAMGRNAIAIDQSDINAFLEFAGHYRFAPLLAHTPYTLNACSADENTRNFAMEIHAH
jgi:deoxyribonuclease IV